MSEKLKVCVYNDCYYTRLGIRYFFDDLYVDVYSYGEFSEYSIEKLACKKDFDFIFFELKSNGENLIEVLNIIINILPLFFPKTKVIIINCIKISAKLNSYLLGLNNIHFIIDGFRAIMEMHLSLKDGLFFSKQKKNVVFKPFSTLLTKNESKVLISLLDGLSSRDISKKLCINYKTVSCHKQSAFKKLGIRSMQALLGNNKKIVHALLAQISRL